MTKEVSNRVAAAVQGSFCSYCGGPFPQEVIQKKIYPRTCQKCLNITYRSFSDLAVVLVPVHDGGKRGVLLIRRAIPPRVGMLALPGGFIDDGVETALPANESWQVAGAREAREELGIELRAADLVELFTVGPTPESGSILNFLLAPSIPLNDLPEFVPNIEVSERVVAWEPVDLAFPTHTETLRWFLTGQEESRWNFSPVMNRYRLHGER